MSEKPPSSREKVSHWDRPNPPHDWRWVIGGIGRILIILGLLMFAFVAYQLWGTGIQTAQAQRSLAREFDELIADGSGDVVWLTGEFFVSVVATPARAHDDNGNSTYPGPTKFRTRNLRNVMAVAVTGDFEGYLSIGIGFRYQSWVRVFTLTSPTRVVIDVGN